MYIYKIDEIYILFRQAQSRYYNRPYRIPKDMDKHINKMSPINKQNLIKITNLFNTAYHNIDPSKYFDCGFQLHGKQFSYNKFFNDKILKLYIVKDKNSKINVDLSKKDFIKSLKFILEWIGNKRNKNISLLIQYSSMFDSGLPAPIKHYNTMKISKYFLVWLIREKIFKVDDDIKVIIPIVIDNYRDILYDLSKIDEFLIKIKNKIKDM